MHLATKVRSSRRGASAQHA
uniref:Uncharacterized protein n=1 Tax=Arundo donax TaxID=35708 RepID=A0A0A8ZDV8_ARUDO